MSLLIIIRVVKSPNDRALRGKFAISFIKRQYNRTQFGSSSCPQVALYRAVILLVRVRISCIIIHSFYIVVSGGVNPSFQGISLGLQ